MTAAPVGPPPDEDVVVPALLAARARSTPDRTFVVHPNGEAWTYAELAERTWRVGNGLADLGVEPGAHVLAWLDAGPQALLTWFGANAAGAVYAPINVEYRGPLLEHAVSLPAASVLVAHVDFVGRLAGLDLPHLRTIVLVGDGDPASPVGTTVVRWDAVASARADPPGPARARRPWDDMLVVYTSGTTGPSKAVRCSYLHHRAFREWILVGGLGAGDRAFVAVPMFHLAATGWIYTYLSCGGSVALLGTFSTSTFWADVRRVGATTGLIMAAMATFLRDRPPDADDADNPLRIAQIGGYIPDASTFADRFDVDIWSGFAMTELPGVTRTPVGRIDLPDYGVPISEDWELRLVDDGDYEVPHGTAGELIVRHRQPWAVNSGYLAMPHATADAWRNGWFHTGDVFVRSTDGAYRFVDRRKDAIRRRGENISSFEVEAEIVRHPEVAEAVVVAVPSAAMEDEVLAYVVREAGATVTAAALSEFLVDRMAHFMVPRYIVFAEELPKTPTHKVKKAELRAAGIPLDAWDREAAGRRLRGRKAALT